ncbi:MAG: hypothetical protein JW807_09845 [Spirochaetes bacterium]|nr:hypothetical protein [Spirochaetota bacterium]
MKNDALVALFGEVMLKYRLSEPASVEVKTHIRREKRRQFKKTLKRAGAYSIIFALISDLFFTLKKAGLPVTIVKSAVILVIVAALMTASVVSGVYLLMTRPYGATETRRDGTAAVDNTVAPVSEEYEVREPPKVIEDRIGVSPFTAVNISGSRANVVSDRIAESLADLRGRDRVLNLRHGRGGKKSGMMLFGAVENVEGVFTITARVVSVKDSRILFYDTEIAGSEADIGPAADRIAKRIFDQFR